MDRDLSIVNEVQKEAHLLREGFEDYGPLMDLIGDAPLVFLGEASHGTHEFYRTRAQITRQLIETKGFCAVAVEADWPDAYRVNRFVRQMGRDATAVEALDDFKRFPTWMWRNRDVVEFVTWLGQYNARGNSNRSQVGFYGLDLYSLNRSMQEVVDYLEKVDPEAAQRARQRYGCFDHYNRDPHSYGYEAAWNPGADCEKEVLAVLMEFGQKAQEHMRRDGSTAEDERFYAEQNARLARNAEAYYRSMFVEHIGSWNLRDRHMFETLQALIHHMERGDTKAKVVVWAHNSHIGDARATEVTRYGELNLGQLAREEFGRQVVLVGLTTYEGTVTAAADWDAPAETKTVRPAHDESFEAVLHQTELAAFYLLLRDAGVLSQRLGNPSRLERAIGVVYLPGTERASHYFEARLAEQFDAVIHFDKTRAVEPLERVGQADREIPQTYPTAV